MANVFQFQKVPVEIQKRNGFDESHRASGTATCGTLVPVLSKFLIPSTEFNLDAVFNVDFAPFATDFKGRINSAIECFWIPERLCSVMWKKFIKQGANATNGVLLQWIFTHGDDGNTITNLIGDGSLADYLGFGLSQYAENIPIGWISPFVGYGLVWDYWYRNKNVQSSLLAEDISQVQTPGREWMLSSFFGDISMVNTSSLPIGKVDDVTDFMGSGSGPLWADTSSLFALRQRNYPKDYFTALFPTTMVNGQTMKVDTSVGDQFDIAQLRAANAGTLFLERYSMAGSDYDDIMYAMYGIRPSDAAVNHPLYLGRIRSVVYNRYVDQNTGSSTPNNRNPFSGSLGSAAARGNSSMRGNLVKNFTTTEHGHLLCLFSIWPDAQYNQGTRRDNLIADITHIPFPLLQSIGFDKVYNGEIFADWSSVAPPVFGAFAYGERYAWYKFEKDHVNGLMRPGANLASFALQRTFATLPSFGSQFLQVGKDDLDNVFAVSQSASGFSCWYDIYFTLHISAPLAAYSIPTLGEPKDARTVWIENGGHML